MPIIKTREGVEVIFGQKNVKMRGYNLEDGSVEIHLFEIDPDTQKCVEEKPQVGIIFEHSESTQMFLDMLFRTRVTLLEREGEWEINEGEGDG